MVRLVWVRVRVSSNSRRPLIFTHLPLNKSKVADKTGLSYVTQLSRMLDATFLPQGMN